MDTTESILTSVKKLLGIDESYTHFDADLIMHINSVFSILGQMGVGPKKGFAISGADEKWSDFLEDDPGRLALVKSYLRQMDNFTIFGSNKRKLRKLLEDIKKWLAEIGMKIKGNWQIFRVGFTPKVERAHQALPKKKQRHRRPRLPSALGYRFGHGYTILRKHNLFRLKQSLHLYYYRRDRNQVISFKRASGLISRLGQLRKCNHQQVLDRHYQPKTMFALKKVVRKECRRLQALYPPYQAA